MNVLFEFVIDGVISLSVWCVEIMIGAVKWINGKERRVCRGGRTNAVGRCGRYARGVGNGLFVLSELGIGYDVVNRKVVRVCFL